jgi:hypothetical protein
MAADGRRTHEEIATAWAMLTPGEMPVVPYFGRGHATLNRLELGMSGQLTISKSDPHWRGNIGWRGDGTVPALSAIPRELGEFRSPWRGVADRHGEFASTATVLDLLTSYTGEAMPTRGGERPDRPWLGLDVEDVVASEEPVPLGMVVLPTDSDAEAAYVTVSDAENRPAPAYSQRLLRDGNEWRGLLPPLAAGRYRLTFEAQRVSGPESVFARTDLVALDPNDEPAGDADMADAELL